MQGNLNLGRQKTDSFRPTTNYPLLVHLQELETYYRFNQLLIILVLLTMLIFCLLFELDPNQRTTILCSQLKRSNRT